MNNIPTDICPYADDALLPVIGDSWYFAWKTVYLINEIAQGFAMLII